MKNILVCYSFLVSCNRYTVISFITIYFAAVLQVSEIRLFDFKRTASIDSHSKFCNQLDFPIIWIFSVKCVNISDLYTLYSFLLIYLINFRIKNGYVYNHYYYHGTHTRAAPWIIGVMLGYCIYLVQQEKRKITIPKVISNQYSAFQ